MKKIFFILLITVFFVLPSLILAQETSLAEEEALGKAIFDQLQAKQTTCSSLSDENFELLGEYYMGQMTGSAHEAMNNMMKQMMGEPGEKQMHIVMGKRLSGCDTSAVYPTSGLGFMPMMGMMGGYGWSGSDLGNVKWQGMMNGRNYYGGPFGMMGGFYGGGTFWMVLWTIFIVALWVLIIVAIIALIKWLIDQIRGKKKK